MAFDRGLAQRLRDIFYDWPGITEREMFGGYGFMIRQVYDQTLIFMRPVHGR